MKAQVQREDSLIKPRQAQNRISGFSTESVLKPLILFCDQVLTTDGQLRDRSLFMARGAPKRKWVGEQNFMGGLNKNSPSQGVGKVKNH